MRPRHRSTLALATSTILLLAACSGGGGESVDMGDAAADDGPDGGDDGDGGSTDDATLVAALGGEPDQLDPHATTSAFSFKVLENVYDTLVQPGPDLQMQPALATEWETSQDLLTWTFTLREDVTFHDGSDFTAKDVKASYDRIIDEDLSNSYRFTSVESVDVVDDTTVEIVLNRPTPNLLTQIGAFKGMAILSSDDIESGFDFATRANGTGAFTLESFTSGSDIQLAAHEDYWGGEDLPYLDAISFRFIPEEAVKLTNLQSGDVDWIDTVPPQRIGELQEAEDITLGRSSGNDYWYLATNIAREPFDDRNVRRAIAFALDPAEIAEAAKFDAATPNETAIPESSFWYLDHSPYGQDVEQAQALLDEAGVSDLTMDLMVTDEYPETVTAAQVVADQLSQVGITVEIRTLDFSTWLDEQGQGNFDAVMLGWLGNLDPDGFYYAQHHSTGSFNFHGYDNAEVDELLDRGRTETDQQARRQIYDEAATLIVDDASYIYLYNPDILNAWSASVSGYETRPDNAVRFVETTKG